MTIDIDTLLKNAELEGTTDKKRESFRNTISWDLLIALLKEIKQFRLEKQNIEKAYVLSSRLKHQVHTDLDEYYVWGIFDSVEAARAVLSNNEDYKGVTWPHDRFWDGKQEATPFEYRDHTEYFRITRYRVRD